MSCFKVWKRNVKFDKGQFENNFISTNDQLSGAHGTLDNQTIEIDSYLKQVEELEEASSDLHNWIVDLKFIPNRKSYDDIEQFQSKILELQEANTALNGVVECSIKLEIVSEPFSETNDDCITKCLLSERTGEAEYFQEGCSEFEEKM